VSALREALSVKLKAYAKDAPPERVFDVATAMADAWSESDHPRVESGPHGGEFGKGGGNSEGGGSAESALRHVKIDRSVTSPEAQEKINRYLSNIPKEFISESSIRSASIYDNPEDAEEAIQELVGDREDARGARGVYDRKTGTLISSLWISEDSGESGRNFYHEFAHSLEDRIVSEGWESAFHEWSEYGQDEGFAEAFAERLVASSEGEESLKNFAEHYPVSDKIFSGWGL
jgi:hypothetical protein